MKKKTLYWILAFFITVSAAWYQRISGPTHPFITKISMGGQTYKIRLPRSHGGPEDCPVRLHIPDRDVHGFMVCRKYPTGHPWDTVSLKRDNDLLTARLPHQPPAGKIEYRLFLSANGRAVPASGKQPVIIRFKGAVPAWALIPHIVLIFSAMLFSTLTGLYAYGKLASHKKYAIITLCLLTGGGFIMGPVVQKFAFGEFWTGFPLGMDLTDNKILISGLFWILAVGGNIRKNRPWLSVIAAVVFLFISSIPHSVMGSELDYESGEITTGLIRIPAPLHGMP